MEPISLKIGIIYSPPLSTGCALNRSCNFPGLGVEATRIVCDHMRWNCTYHWYASTDYGDLPHENSTEATGLVGAIQRGQFDTSFPVFTPTYRRSKVIDFAEMIFSSDIVMVTRSVERHTDNATNWNVVMAWQWPIWCCFVIAILVTATFLIFNSWNPRMCKSKKRHLPMHYFETVAVLMNIEHGLHRLKRSPIRVVFGFWTVGAVVLGSAYTGVLFSRRIIDDSHPPFVDLPTFAECLERRECRIVGATLSISFLQIFTSKDSSLGSRISRTFDYNPPLLVNSQDDVPEKILEIQNQYLVGFVDIASALDFVQKYEQCKFRVVDTQYSETWTFPVRKNSSLLKSLNKASAAFQERGVAKALLLKYATSRNTQCDSGGGGGDLETNVRGIAFEEINLTFYFFVGGSCAAVACFFVEVLYTNVWRRSRDEDAVYGVVVRSA